MYRLVIFDFDGTLADSAGWFRASLAGFADRHGFRQVDEAEIERLRGLTTREIMAALGVSPWRLPFIAADMRRRVSEDAEAIPLFDGAGAMLAAVRAAGLKVAVVSSNAEANVRRILGPEVVAHVDHFDCGAGLFGKAGHFRKVMKRLGVGPAQTLCVGDEHRDVEAAHAVGAASASVLWGYATRESLERAGPTHLVEAMTDIPGLLAARTG